MRAYANTNRPPNRERDRLIAEHIEVARRITLRVARRCPSWISIDDLLAAGMVGLTEAADRYDEGREEPFVAFAEKRIRGAVLDELRRGDIMPRRLRNQARKVGRTIRRLEQELGRDPEDEEVAAALGVPVEEYREELEMLTHVTVGSFDDDPGAFDRHATGGTANPEVQAQRAEILGRIRSSLEHLAERDALVLSLYYNEEFTYAEIGDLLGVSVSRVSQLHARAIARLRAQIETPMEAA